MENPYSSVIHALVFLEWPGHCETTSDAFDIYYFVLNNQTLQYIILVTAK